MRYKVFGVTWRAVFVWATVYIRNRLEIAVTDVAFVGVDGAGESADDFGALLLGVSALCPLVSGDGAVEAGELLC